MPGNRPATGATPACGRGSRSSRFGATHRLRGNRVGADRLLRRAAAALTPFADAAPYDIDLERLISWAEQPQDRAMPALHRSQEDTRAR